VLLNEKAPDVLYNDATQTKLQMCSQSTVKQSLRSFKTGCAYASGDVKVPKTYFVTKEDQAIPYAGQMAMAQGAGAQIIELNSGHSPFLKREETEKILETIKAI
jgi:hypothetical protein